MPLIMTVGKLRWPIPNPDWKKVKSLLILYLIIIKKALVVFNR